MRLNAWKTFSLSLSAVVGTPSLSAITLPLLAFFLLPSLIATYYPEFSFRLADVADVVEYPEIAGAFAIRLLILIFQILYVAFAAGVIVTIVWNGMESGRANLGTGIKKGILRCLPILSSSLLFCFFVGLGFVALVLPGILLSTLLFYFLPASVVDGCGILDSFVRSFALSRKNFLYTLLLALIVLVLTALVILFSYGATILFPDWGWAGPLIAGILATFFFPLALTTITVGYANVKA